MTKKQIEEKVKELILDELGDGSDKFNADNITLGDMGFDSLDAVCR